MAWALGLRGALVGGGGHQPGRTPNKTAAATVAITYPRKVFGSPLFRLPARAADGALPP
ncbi:hypothetical protein [Streptomyces sp. NPDC012746]|uniref:hypothetical protein n=1 Tax=Streptomyces sp. NPDC012746 TaxID=3364845 RepID=UPI00367B56DB